MTQDAFFDAVIDGLERNHAFREVKGGGPIVERRKAELAPRLAIPCRIAVNVRINSQEPEGIGKEDADWVVRNFDRGLKVYMPLKYFLPWLHPYLMETLRAEPGLELANLARKHAHFLAHDLENHRQPPLDESPDKPPMGFSKYSRAQAEIARNVVARHPNLLQAHTVLQSSFPEWHYRLAMHLQHHLPLSPGQAVDARDTIGELSDALTTPNYVRVPILWVAVEYDKRVEGDYSRPLIEKDFQKGWEASLKEGGFTTVFAGNDGGNIKVQCPFIQQASASAEVCAEGKTGGVGCGIWRIFDRLENGKAPAGYAQVAAQIKDILGDWRKRDEHFAPYLYDKRIEMALEDYAAKMAGCPAGPKCVP